MTDTIFIAVDWINLEGRLTAYFSGDKTLQTMLDEELQGGYKVHARTAGLLYGIDPADAKTYMVNLQGQQVPAYDGGKRLRHMFHYGGKPRKMAQTFWLPLKEAECAYETLCETHPGIPEWWQRLGDEVFGVPRYLCGRCSHLQGLPGACEACNRKHSGYVQQVRWQGWEREPQRVHYTPFGRRRIYRGRRSESMNALISQDPQSCGASMWYRSLARLSGRRDWPVPEGGRIYNGVYSTLKERHPIDIATGTYDSFLTAAPKSQGDEVIQWVTWTVEQPWPQLGGLRIPADVQVGHNWGKANAHNPQGLTDYEYRPFSAQHGADVSTSQLLLHQRANLQLLSTRAPQ